MNVLILAKKLKISNSIKFAGHTVSDQGIKPDPSPTDTIRQFPRPTNLTELRSLMGLANQGSPSYQIWPRTLLKWENCFLPKTHSYGYLNMNKSFSKLKKFLLPNWLSNLLILTYPPSFLQTLHDWTGWGTVSCVTLRVWIWSNCLRLDFVRPIGVWSC